MLDDRVQHDAEHGNEDHQADDQQQSVEGINLFRDLRDRRLEVKLHDRRAARTVFYRPG